MTVTAIRQVGPLLTDLAVTEDVANGIQNVALSALLFDDEYGHGRVDLPYALHRKYPGADCELGWQYVFPSRQLSKDRRSGI